MSSLAMVLYQICLQKYDDVSVSVEFIQYRMAELFIYTYKHTPSADNANNNIDGNTNHFDVHCLLFAEALLRKTYFSYKYAYPTTDIHESLPYTELYLADIEYNLITLFGFNYDLIIEECRSHATNYQNSKYAKDKKSCIYIINMLNSQVSLKE